jgi:serine/threonine protein kinase
MTAPSTPTPIPVIDRLRRATLGRYDIVATLGEGGMATVFLARDLSLNRQVAIKVMHPSLMTSAAALGRFRREARIAAALDHPHIISIFNVGEDPELAYYVMRYVEGQTLHHLIAEAGALPVRRALAIVEAVGQALQHAHSRGVIHRDIKPANIMVLDQDDWIVVTDFGIAKLDEGEQITMSGHVVGTPNYMCPEYFNHGIISAASDQYALGVVTYQLLAGVLPFGGATVGELMRGHILDPIPTLTSERPDLSPQLDKVLARMLAKEPKERFATIGDAVAALKAAMHDATPSDVITEIIRTPVTGGRRKGRVSGAVSLITRSRWRMAGTVGFVTIVGWLGTVAIRDGIVRAPATRDEPTLTPSTVTVPPTDPGTNAATTSAPPPVATPAPNGSPPAATPATGTIRIGSRIPLAVLRVNGGSARLIGEQGLQTLTTAAGEVRLSIRADGCTAWDTTFQMAAASTHTIGYRAPRC